MNKTTTIINLFGGPGAGKTTCAWEIAAALKKKGFVTEYVSEYPKELVWDGKPEKLIGTLENQTAIYEEQKRRVDRLIGKVDFVVTDSPTLLSLTYLKEPNIEFEDRISREFKDNNNFCMIVQRGKKFEEEGRVHTLEQSKQIDEEIRQLLVREDIPFGVYRHGSIEVAIENMIRVHWGKEQEKTFHTQKPPLETIIKNGEEKALKNCVSSTGVTEINR